ncbi:MAG: RNA polymerase sigma factor [Deltaproteobacteria bacterium]|nr:RNA polymerase sigma factor [Deltaproteobacteria bacterium]
MKLAFDEGVHAPLEGDDGADLEKSQTEAHLRQLLQNALAGSVAARNELLAKLLPRMVAVTRSALMPASAADVEDVVQEALLRLNRSLTSFRGESSLSYFATRVAVHAATDFVRRKIARRKYENEAAQSGDDPDAVHLQAAWDDGTRSRLRILLDDLSDVQAETLILTALGYSVQEVAVSMDVPLETVRSRLRLARKAVRDRIAADPQLQELFGRQS